MKQAGVYILQSEKNHRYYIGSTNDVSRRLTEHNAGKVASTKRMTPWVIKVFIKCDSITEAKSAEYRLKQYKRRDILEKVINDSLLPWAYNKENLPS